MKSIWSTLHLCRRPALSLIACQSTNTTIQQLLFELPNCRITMSKRSRGTARGSKLRVTLGLPAGAVINCADNTGAKNLYMFSVKGVKGHLNRLPSACVGDMVLATVKKGRAELRKKVTPAIVIRQRNAWRRKDGTLLYFEGKPRGNLESPSLSLWCHSS